MICREQILLEIFIVIDVHVIKQHSAFFFFFSFF